MLKDKMKIRKVREGRLRKRIRDRVRGTAERPRVHVFKSNLYIYTQVVNDDLKAVLAAASTLEKDFREKAKGLKNMEACGRLGDILALRLKEKQISKVVFDRGISPYHGRIKALADALRKQGIEL